MICVRFEHEINHKNWLKIEKSRKISETADVTLENLKRKVEKGNRRFDWQFE